MSTGWGWGGCNAHCKEHIGICMVHGPHDVHDTGMHTFTEEERFVYPSRKSGRSNPGKTAKSQKRT